MAFPKKSKLILLLVGLVLLVAVVRTGMGAARHGKLTPVDIKGALPTALPGWTVTDLPLMETPELQKVAAEVLGFDQVVVRNYKKNGRDITVFVAYWLPGKVPETLVEAHTPDICWVANGWELKSSGTLPDRVVGGVTVKAPNYRVFSKAGGGIEVAYWHFYGRTLRKSASVDEANLSFSQRMVRRLQQVEQGVMGRPEQQLFIRVSSNFPVNEALGEAPGEASLSLMARALLGEPFYSEKS